MTKMQLAAKIARDQAGAAYVFGTTGQMCTVNLRERQMSSKPAYADKIERYCPALRGGSCSSSCKYKGRRAFDCRGLTYWALKQAGLKISSVGATTQWNTDSWASKGRIENLPRDQPVILFKQDDGNTAVMAHTGFGLSDGQAVDARGHASGVKLAEIDSYPWTHWAIPYGADDPAQDPDMEDDGEGQGTTRPLLRKGASGEDVRYLQAVLIACGYSLPKYGADGSYGAESIAAVMQYQRDHDLDPDGIVGPLTWAKIERALVGDQEKPGDKPATYTVTIPGLSFDAAQLLLDMYEGAVSVMDEETEE